MISDKTMSMIEIQVNGQSRKIVVRNADTLLYVLREQLGLTGAKPGCENGDCGTCTILLNGWPINACHMLAVGAANQSVITIEGLQNTPIQRAFVDKCAVQCGYCTPGYILNCHSLLFHHPHADEETIQDWLRSNLCRCTGYEEIREAVQSIMEEQ